MAMSILQIKPLLNGAWARGALGAPGGAQAHDGESDHPIDDALGTGSFGEAQGRGEEPQDPGDGAKADASDQHQWQGHPYEVHFGRGGGP